MAGVTVLFGDGSGEFPNSSTLTTTTDCQRILTGPFTTETDFEFLAICSNGTSGGARQLFSAGSDRTITAQGTATPTIFYRTTVIGRDFNRDGFVDIATGEPRILLSDGSGDFSSAVLGDVDDIYGLEAADLDGDGTWEVISQSNNGASAHVFRFDADNPRFAEESFRYRMRKGFNAIHGGDLNGDGLFDFVDGRDLTAFIGRRNGATATDFAQVQGVASGNRRSVRVGRRRRRWPRRSCRCLG